ncbi:MAG: LCP family protein [Actinophytocola sp.]|uniref:LCP family protein n=1 Tax=Actinophytocola sp. TaxID=1872138 RepID=UPI003D6AB8FE
MDERTQVLAAHPQASSGWRRAGRNSARSIVALTSVAVLGTMGYGWWAFGDVDDGTVTTEVIAQDVENQRVPLDGAVDMLLVGIDSRTDANGDPLPREVLDLLNAGDSGGERNTDTMILVHIPVDGTRAVAISFPRDSWVELAGDYGEHRLNSAFAYAYNGAREELADKVGSEKELDARATVAGRKNLIATVQNLIGKAVTIDRYAEVNLASFYEITKAIGGVDVCLKADTEDPLSGADFFKGVQTIAGRKALAFVRQRHGLENGDLDRIMRQQAFLGAIANKVLSAEMLTSPTKVRELVSAVQRSVVLSNGFELSKFAAQMSGLSSTGIDFYTIPVVGDANIGGADVLEVDRRQVARFVESLTTDEDQDEETSSSPPTTTTTPPTRPTKPPPGTAPPDEGGRPSLGLVTVDVRNGSNTSGLAASVRTDLTQRGFNPGDIGDSVVQGSSTIRYAPGERNLAQYVADQLGGSFSLFEDVGQQPGRIEVVLGTDYQAPAGFTGDRLVQPQPPTDPPSGSPTGSSGPGQPPTSSSSPPPPQLNAGGLNCVN